MADIDATDANNLLAAQLGIGGATYTAVTGTHIRLGTNAPSAGSNMTELTGTGYTAGGSSISWTAPSGQSTSNSGAVSWTNGSGSAWAIVGIEIWDIAGTPKRHLWGTWTGQPIAVANGNIFAVATSAVSATLV